MQVPDGPIHRLPLSEVRILRALFCGLRDTAHSEGELERAEYLNSLAADLDDELARRDREVRDLERLGRLQPGIANPRAATWTEDPQS